MFITHCLFVVCFLCFGKNNEIEFVRQNPLAPESEKVLQLEARKLQCVCWTWYTDSEHCPAKFWAFVCDSVNMG